MTDLRDPAKAAVAAARYEAATLCRFSVLRIAYWFYKKYIIKNLRLRIMNIIKVVCSDFKNSCAKGSSI